MPTPPACASFPLICWQCVPYSSRQSCLLFYILIFSLFRFHSFCSLNSRLVSCLHSTLSAVCVLFACLSGTGYCILVTIYLTSGIWRTLAFGIWVLARPRCICSQPSITTQYAVRCSLHADCECISNFIFHVSHFTFRALQSTLFALEQSPEYSPFNAHRRYKINKLYVSN